MLLPGDEGAAAKFAAAPSSRDDREGEPRAKLRVAPPPGQLLRASALRKAATFCASTLGRFSVPATLEYG